MEPLTITASNEWHIAHPGAIIGLLEISGVEQSAACTALSERKRQVEAHLRQQYAGFTRKDFLALPVMAAYDRYYRRFEKTYHVLQQVESIVHKGKNLPDVSLLVDANFTAEVETLVLTASHDVERLLPPVWIDVSRAGEQMTQMSGNTRLILPGDMLMRDRDGVACTILYGQDNRSPVSIQTRRVLYVSYAPPGVGAQAVLGHLHAIFENVRLCVPACVQEQMRLIEADVDSMS